MLRESRTEGVPDRIADVAEAIAEEGLRYVSDASPGYKRKRTGTSFSYYDTNPSESVTRLSFGASSRSAFLQPTSSSGSVPRPTGTSRPQASMPEAESNTATIQNGASCESKTSTSM